MDEKKNISVNVSDNTDVAAIQRKKVNFQKLFHKVSVIDYAVMWFLADKARQADENQKFYLKELAATSGVPMHIITEMVRILRDKGLVSWKHDGSGEEGTYIQVTSSGVRAVMEQRDILKDFQKNVIEKFGNERFLNLLHEMSEFEDIMNNEIERGGTKNE